MDTDTARIKKPSQRYNETYRAKLAQDPEWLTQRLMSNRASSAKYKQAIKNDPERQEAARQRDRDRKRLKRSLAREQASSESASPSTVVSEDQSTFQTNAASTNGPDNPDNLDLSHGSDDPYSFASSSRDPLILGRDSPGIHIHSKSSFVKSVDGFSSPVPFLPRDGAAGDINALAADELMARWMLSFPGPQAASGLVKVLNAHHYQTDTTPDRMVSDIRFHLSQRIAVHVRHASELPFCLLPSIDPLNVSSVCRFTTKSEHEEIEVHADETHMNGEIVYTTLQNFILDMQDPNNVQVIQDLKSKVHVPLVCYELDDGRQHGWLGTAGTYPAELKDTSTFATPVWMLLHHGNWHTMMHQDAAGLCTWLGVVSGPKIWSIAKPKLDPLLFSTQQIAELTAQSCGWKQAPPQSDNFWSILKTHCPWMFQGDHLGSVEIKSDCFVNFDLEMFVMEPGDFLFQPPGTLHTVLTPQPGVSIGGQYYNYDTMHLTEMARYIDHLQGQITTNEEHNYVNLLYRMVLALPDLGDREFYERPLVALCAMVLWPKDYVAQPPSQMTKSAYAKYSEGMVASKLWSPACGIAQIVLRFINIGRPGINSTKAETMSYLHNAVDGRWRDRGAVVSLQDADW
ncbi:hypothetical protein HGRIS_014868 [Hohenbuehelia grisea]|uniref:JmjC domain-containing protein n=1 Tax=Hohenbuehelia grisea TaxID=104357 RepID=A0ABR3IQX9_9AGAR